MEAALPPLRPNATYRSSWHTPPTRHEGHAETSRLNQRPSSEICRMGHQVSSYAAAGIGRRWWIGRRGVSRTRPITTSCSRRWVRIVTGPWSRPGCRPGRGQSELLGATVGDVDPGQQLITVIRKGTGRCSSYRRRRMRLCGCGCIRRSWPGGPVRARPSVVVDAAATFPGVALRRGKGDVHPGQRRVGVELVAARSSPHRGVPDGVATRRCR